jgi:TPR repeat protein
LFDASDDDARALEAYRKAAELGSTSFYTHYRIAQLTWKHDPDRETLQAIRRSLERAVELNDGYASAYSYLAEVTSDLGEPEKALSLARRALALEPGSSRHYVSLARVHWDLKQPDDARAAGQRSLALARTTGERSNAQAFLDFLTSASARAAEAARVELAAACWGGDGDACVQASPELERRCLQADARSCSGLAWIHRTGTGLPADPAKVATFRARGCDAGDKRACVEAAWSQARGEGVPKDEAKAWATLDGLCGEGVLHACTRLGLLHAYKGTRADLARAKQLLRKACAGDEGEACSALSTMPN